MSSAFVQNTLRALGLNKEAPPELILGLQLAGIQAAAPAPTAAAAPVPVPTVTSAPPALPGAAAGSPTIPSPGQAVDWAAIAAALDAEAGRVQTGTPKVTEAVGTSIAARPAPRQADAGDMWAEIAREHNERLARENPGRVIITGGR